MKKLITLLFIGLLPTVFSQEASDSLTFEDLDSIYTQIENSFTYQTGIIELKEGHGTLTVPKGFKFLDKEQSITLLTDYFGNPKDNSVLGILAPENISVFDDKSWLFILSFEEMGYVKDDDANDIDYDQLEAEMKAEISSANPERIKQGFEPEYFIGWASDPYYDDTKKTLHWAKEFKFGDAEVNTLNYNIRILGRKGVFMFNALSLMPELEVVKSNIDPIINSIEFHEGFAYSDFDPDVDDVAAWTIGGLVAGKLLAKVGFWALIVKFWKLILLGFAGIGSFLWKKKKNKDESSNTAQISE